MTTPPEPPAVPASGEISDDGVFEVVRDGYDAVYEAVEASPTFGRIWRTHAYGSDFPEEFAHIGFLTLAEAERLLRMLAVSAGSVLVDLACGAGGPGLWMARASGASLVGIDPAPAGLAAARRRAGRVGLEGRCRFEAGSFERTGLANGVADGLMSVEAFQYAPDKAAALAEAARVLRPGGHLGVICFEVDPARVVGVPVLGVDPVADYRPLLVTAGFSVEEYVETPGWEERVYGAFGALLDAADALTVEMGEAAAGGVLAEAALTVAARPYRRRVLAVARRPG